MRITCRTHKADVSADLNTLELSLAQDKHSAEGDFALWNVCRDILRIAETESELASTGVGGNGHKLKLYSEKSHRTTRTVIGVMRCWNASQETHESRLRASFFTCTVDTAWIRNRVNAVHLHR